jgi:hypothetical protein
MPGPAPAYRPPLTPAAVAACERLLRRPTAPQAQVARATLALLLHARPGLDTAAAARQLGRQVNWVFRWRRAWALEGFRLTDKPGRGRRPTFSPPRGGDGAGPGRRTPRAA